MIQVSLKSIHLPMLKEKQIGFNFYIAHFMTIVFAVLFLWSHTVQLTSQSLEISGLR